MNNEKTLLRVKDLSVSFNTQNGLIKIIDDISFDIYSGENLAIVGESGSGKSVTAFSLLRLHDEKNTVYSDAQIQFQNNNLLELSDDEIKDVRGKNISMIFQEPMTSLNPVFTIGQQIEEVLTLHQNMNKTEKKAIKAKHKFDKLEIKWEKRALKDVDKDLDRGIKWAQKHVGM